MAAEAALQLLLLGVLDFVYVLVSSRLLPPSLWWQCVASAGRMWLALWAVGSGLSLWLMGVVVAGLAGAVTAKQPVVLTLVVCPALEEAFFRGAVMAVPLWLPLRVLLSTLWFLSAHDFADPWGRGLRSVAYCLLWEWLGLPAAVAAHVAGNAAKRMLA